MMDASILFFRDMTLDRWTLEWEETIYPQIFYQHLSWPGDRVVDT